MNRLTNLKKTTSQNHTFNVARLVNLRKISSSLATMSSETGYRMESDAFGPIKVESSR